MLLFHSSRPRRFHREYMYVDGREELLDDIEQRARRGLNGEEVPEGKHREELQRKISGSLKPEVLRHRGNRFTTTWVLLILSAGVIALLASLLLIVL